LQNNTSWFIAADFDKENWIEDCTALINTCKTKGIHAYLERSRSGMGGHVWVFFDKPYPATRSRNILISILEQTRIFSVFDKSSSFDRLFPNQDFHSGKGLGNLIALPFNRLSLEKGNNCFVDENIQPYGNQWEYISSIQKTPISLLDDIYKSLISKDNLIPYSINSKSEKLILTLNNHAQLNQSGLKPVLIDFLKEELNFANSEYFIKKKTGRNTWGTERYFRFINETDHDIIVPRGFIGKLIRYCQNQKIDFTFDDQREKLDSIDFNFNLELRKHQGIAIEAAKRKDFGIITAPPGSGKTVIGLKIIAEKRQPALIILHRKQLFEQWAESIQAFLGIPKNEIGSIKQGKVKPGKAITIAMIQSLTKHLSNNNTSDFTESFGTIIIDECHHIPAETYRSTISKFSSYYQYGLTATPFRKGSDGKILFIYLGDIISEIRPQQIEEYKSARIIIRNTSFDIPYNPKTDPFETLSKILIHDSTRNKLILKDVTTELNKGRKAVIITERKEHINVLNQFLKQSFETIMLSGDDNENSRTLKWKTLKKGDYQALITTGQFFGEGSDLQNANCLFLVYPFSFKGKLIQYIGRVQRSEIHPNIYDYRDFKIDYLNRLFLKRNKYYRHLDKQATLFDDEIIDLDSLKDTYTLEKKIKVPIDKLDFGYGVITFNYSLTKVNKEFEFEIENNFIRPEFDVLKPFFAKVLKSKQVEIQIFAEFENKILVSQSASSSDLESINREIIDGVKFKFVEKTLLKKQFITGHDKNILNINELQEGQNGKLLFNSEEDLLNDLLKNKNVKHYSQMRYLASKHDNKTIKLRFVLNPFSFVFLITGREQYHIVLETLDTEEATYIWHFEKYQRLPIILQSVDKDLSNIKNKGRQYFLENHPVNFSKLIHDYSEERKGFIIWRDLLEEKLA
jgi:superfamily II DNA or RNA helicase